jgi:hypothetical protein
MSYADEKVKAGRVPITFVELDLDTCSLVYGVGACTAAGGAGAECYNTRASCQVPGAYARTSKTIRFAEPVDGMAGYMPAGESFIPSVLSVNYVPTRIKAGFGLGYRASVTVSIQDHPHHDRGLDPYVDTRTYDPASQGTLWGRLRARTPYYQGRTMRVRSGYLTGAGVNWSNFESREYVIEELRGPDKSGRVQVIGKDVLKLADDDRSKAPQASGGELISDLGAVADKLFIVNGTYASSGWVRVGSELIKYTGKTGAGTATDPWVLTGADRNDNTFGSASGEHSAGDNVQQCLVYQDVNARDVIDDLLVNYAGVSSGYIPAADWDAEESKWLDAATLTACISEPTGVDELVAEIQEQCMIRVWWDEVNQDVKLKVMAPPTGEAVDVLTDDFNFVQDSLDVRDIAKDRISQVWIYYDKADHTDDDQANYRRLYIQVDPAAETADQYNEPRIHVIESRWLDASNLAMVSQTASRLLSNRRDNPIQVKFSMDAKDSEYRTGDIVDLQTHMIQNADGSEKLTRVIIEQVREAVGGHRFDYLAMSGIGDERYANIGPNTLSDYTLESDSNILKYAFICDSITEQMSNGDEGYKIV